MPSLVIPNNLASSLEETTRGRRAGGKIKRLLKMRTNYIGCIGLTIFRVMDIILTAIIISLGGGETNWMGFTPIAITLILSWTAAMWFLSYYVKENEPYQSILFVIIMLFAGISAVVVGYSCRLLIMFYL